MLALKAEKISTSFAKTASRLFSKLWVMHRSTALLESKVAIATWSAEAYSSDRLVVVGNARLITRMRRSPDRQTKVISKDVTTKGECKGSP